MKCNENQIKNVQDLNNINTKNLFSNNYRIPNFKNDIKINYELFNEKINRDEKNSRFTLYSIVIAILSLVTSIISLFL